MLDGRPSSASNTIRIVVVTGDAEFEKVARSTFGNNPQIDLGVVAAGLGTGAAEVDFGEARVIVVDLDADHPEQIQALQSLAARLGSSPPIVVVTQAFSETVARRLLQIRIADFMVKPVSPIELVRACARVAQGTATEGTREAQIYT